MPYNSNIHHRRSIRLKGYDYTQAGLYFITICCDKRQYRFGKIEAGIMVLNECGQIAYNEWRELTARFTNFELDVFQIMPNHLHGIIILRNPTAVGSGFTPDLNDKKKLQPLGQPQGLPQRLPRQPLPESIGNIIGAYKSLVANKCLNIYKTKNEIMEKLWQRNYYEHIIRNETAYQNISNYIIKNPEKWQEDTFFKKIIK